MLTWWKSLFRIFKVRRLSKVLSGIDFSRSAESFFEGSDRREEALRELLDLCEANEPIHKIIEKHGAGREQLEELYEETVGGNDARRHESR